MTHSPVVPSPSPVNQAAVFSLWDLAKYFLWLGGCGFGGPLSLVGYMQRDLTEKRGWVPRTDFLNGWALASLCPGPLATQLAIYIGWLHARVWGATVIFFAFTLPSFLIILVLAISYAHYAEVSWARSAFYGMSACVIVVIIRNSYKLSRMIIAHNHWLWGVFFANLGLSIVTSIKVYWLLLLSGVVVWGIKAPPRFIFSQSFLMALGASLGLLGDHSLLWKLFFYFIWAGMVVFGGGFAIIPFVHEGVVLDYQWLTERQFVDAISIGMITPGPIVLIVAFMGYLIAGFKGALAATFAIFLPCYLFVVALAPHFNRIAHHEAVKAFVQGVTVASAGAITSVAFTLGKNILVDGPSLGIFMGAAGALYCFRKVPEPIWFLAAGVLGVLLKGMG